MRSPGADDRADGRPGRWFLAVAAGYLVAFALLAVAVHGGIAIGVAYGVWAAAGVALVAVASRVLFGEPLTRVMVLGIVLIVVGVVAVEVGAHH